MAGSESFLRQLSSKQEWKSTSRRWGNRGRENNLKKMEELNSIYGSDNQLSAMKKRVMVVVDESVYSKHALMWALTHVANKGDILILLHIVSPSSKDPDNSPRSHFPALCKASNPEVEVQAVVIQGPKVATIMKQVRELEISVLILGQKNPSTLLNCLCFRSSTEDFVEQCINTVECLTIGVRKQSKGVGGYLISTRWHKDFWLLA